MKIPMLNIPKMHEPIREELIDKMTEVLDSGQHINSHYIEAFESELAGHCESAYAIATSSGSDALILSMMAFGVNPGAEIITTTFTFFATAGAIARLGAKPVFVDIDPKTFNIDPTAIATAVTPKTIGIITVPLFGLSCDMDPILEIAKQHNLWVLEDAAQSIGARYKGQMVGTMGNCGTYSFFPAKNLGCVGDGGAILTQDEAFYEKLKMLRNHGGKQRHYYDEVGGNFRMDALQAAILSVKLPHLKGWERQRRETANKYHQAFAGISYLETPFIPENCLPVYNQYTLRVKEGKRDQLKQALEGAGISTMVYYPLCLHQQQCFAHLGYQDGAFPIAEQAAQEVLSIPIFTDHAQTIIDTILAANL